MTGVLDDQINFKISSTKDELELKIEIFTDENHYTIRESKNECLIRNKNGDISELTEKIIFFQSELTPVVCQELIEGKPLSLPAFNECVKPHLLFINELKIFFEVQLGLTLDRCPIT